MENIDLRDLRETNTQSILYLFSPYLQAFFHVSFFLQNEILAI